MQCKNYLLATLFVVYASIANAQITIDLTKTLAGQTPVSVSEADLDKLTLTGLNPADDKNKFKFSVGNAAAISAAVNASAQVSGTTLTFDIGGLDQLPKSDGPYKFKIDYLGAHTPVAATANVIEFDITILKPVEQADHVELNEIQIMNAVERYVDLHYNFKKHYSEKTGLYLDGNTVHIFIDQNGNQILTGLPTTAKESYLYQVHLLTVRGTGDARFRFSYEGRFVPEFNIEKTSEDIATENSDGEPADDEIIVDETRFPRIGPFTDHFLIKLKKLVSGQPDDFLLDNRIDVAKLYHVSISTGLLATTLRNPSNVEKMAMPNGAPGDTTLVADDPAVRGLLSIMAIYYPKGRSFLFPPSGGLFSAERFGVVVGAQLNDKLQENFLAGFSFDFARGGSVALGAHFGRRSYIAGYDKFKFGEDRFTGDLVVKKEWQVGLFFGVVIDTRVALKLFNLGDPE
jgi:hypothetical protein